MKLRIYKEKLSQTLHLKELDENALASQIYHEQVEKGWPGLAKETKEICEELRIEDVNTTTMNKSEFKRLLKGAIETKNEEILKQKAQNKLKYYNTMKDKYGRKDYMNEKKIEEFRFTFVREIDL